MVSIYTSRIHIVVLLLLVISQAALAQCTFSPSALVTNLSCYGANDGAINVTISSSGGSGGTGSYCTSTYSNPCGNCPTTWDHINNFSTTGGSTNISNLNSGCTGSLPSNYTAYSQTVTVNPGGSFGFAVQSANTSTGCSNQFGQGFHIWIDWNDDGDFLDAGEDIWSYPPDFSLLTGTITVPANVSCGIRRMRVLCAYAQTPADPCGFYGYGETEDYNVQIGPPITYSWSNGATTEDISGLAPGPYSVTITDGIQDTVLSYNVGQPSQVISTVTAAGPTSICPGQSLVLNASGAPTWNYTWSNGATGNSITIDQPGTYSVTASNSNGCSTTSQIDITSATSTSPPIITPSDTSLLCQGGTLTLSVPASYNPTWQPGGQITASIDVTASGDYFVTYTDASGCTGESEPATVIVIPPPVVTITPSGPTSFCEGGSVVLTSNYPAGNLWSTGATTASITVTTSGDYSVTVSAGAACSDDESMTVTVNPTPATQITASGPLSFCQGGNVTLTATPAGAASYAWSNGGGSLAQLSVTSTSSYSVTVTDANGCSAADGPVDVTVNPIPTAPFITADGPTTLCDGGSVNLSSSYFSGNTWSNGQTASSINVSQSGTYSVTYTDAIGCSAASSSIDVTVNPVPSATFTLPATACIADNATVTYTGGASASAEYYWDFGGATSNGSAQGPYTLSFPNVGTYTVSLFVIENGCASNPVTNNVIVSTNPSADFTVNDFEICLGDNVDVTYTGGAPSVATFAWTFGGLTVVSGSGIGPYTLQGTAADSFLISLVVTQGSCVSEPFILPVLVDALPLISIDATLTSACDSLTTQFTTYDYGGTYAWSFGDGGSSFQPSPTHSYPPGVYDVSLAVVDANGCANSGTSAGFISVYATPIASFTSTPPLVDTLELDQANISFDNTSQNATSYAWDFGDAMTSTMASPSHVYMESGTYQVSLVATNPLGCADTAMSEMFFVAPGAVLFVPTLFTPNGDGLNDVFHVYSNLLDEVYVTVYDRIGQRVFETRDLDQGWDGNFKGHPMNTGVFVWYAKVKYTNGHVEEYMGDVSLLR